MDRGFSLRIFHLMRTYSSVKAEQVEMSHTYFRVFGTCHNLEKPGRNTTNHKLEHRRNNPKSLTLYVGSNEVLIQEQGYLRVDFHLFYGTWDNRAVWENRKSKLGHMKSNPKSPPPWFTFKQVITQILKAIHKACFLAFCALWQFWRNWAQVP